MPPRGEVNAADAFDIGSFDSDETRGVKVRGRPCYFYLIDLHINVLSLVLIRVYENVSDCSVSFS